MKFQRPAFCPRRSSLDGERAERSTWSRWGARSLTLTGAADFAPVADIVRCDADAVGGVAGGIGTGTGTYQDSYGILIQTLSAGEDIYDGVIRNATIEIDNGGNIYGIAFSGNGSNPQNFSVYNNNLIKVKCIKINKCFLVTLH